MMQMTRKELLSGVVTGVVGGVFGQSVERGVSIPGGTSGTGIFRGMQGAFSAMYTPYTADNKINLEMIDRIVDYGLRNGLAGFYVTGSTGESLYLSVEERAQVIARAVKAVNGRGKVIAHVGYPSTDDAVRCAKLAADAGADWISAMQPGFLVEDAEPVINHYRRIAESTDRPLLVYSWQQEIDLERELRLFDIRNVCGMKYTGNDFYSVQKLKRRLNKETAFYVGNDPMLLSGLVMRNVFSGGIGLNYNFMPRLYAKVCECAFADRYAEAAKWQDEANRALDVLAMPDYSLWKMVMKYIGLDCGPCRHPFDMPSEEKYEGLCRMLDKLGIIRRNDALL